jgi:hypothetical protein
MTTSYTTPRDLTPKVLGRHYNDSYHPGRTVIIQAEHRSALELAFDIGAMLFYWEDVLFDPG